MGAFSGPEGRWPGRVVLPSAHTAVVQSPQPAGLFSFSDPGRKEGRQEGRKEGRKEGERLTFSSTFAQVECNSFFLSIPRMSRTLSETGNWPEKQSQAEASLRG